MTEENNKILDKHVGHQIKERRKVLGLTQTELAEILGISFQQVQRYESGENTISLPRILEIANILNVKPNFFYDHAPVEAFQGKRPTPDIICKDLARPLRILLVEDTPSDELLFRKAVERGAIECDIHAIQDSQKVMDFLCHHKVKYGMEKPDLIILDFNMPRLNGLGVLKKIKNDPQLKLIPVIMLTNSVRSKDMMDAYRYNANGFIQKNSDLHGFYDDVNRTLEFWSKTVVLPSVA
jgi:CheY-like chemotaxis protein